jgi:hypothetical protein
MLVTRSAVAPRPQPDFFISRWLGLKIIVQASSASVPGFDLLFGLQAA